MDSLTRHIGNIVLDQHGNGDAKTKLQNLENVLERLKNGVKAGEREGKKIETISMKMVEEMVEMVTAIKTNYT